MILIALIAVYVGWFFLDAHQKKLLAEERKRGAKEMAAWYAKIIDARLALAERGFKPEGFL
jgi:hypothetical protein